MLLYADGQIRGGDLHLQAGHLLAPTLLAEMQLNLGPYQILRASTLR